MISNNSNQFCDIPYMITEYSKNINNINNLFFIYYIVIYYIVIYYV